MNNVMCVPNHNENELIFNVNIEKFEKIHRELLKNGFKTNLKYIPVIEQIPYDTITFLKFAKINIKRFITTKTIIKKEWYKKQYIKDGEKNKVKKLVEFEFPVLLLRESVLQYLKFKTKDVPEKKKQYWDSETHHIRHVSKSIYKKVIQDLEKTFEYYTRNINNATLDESLNYEVNRLLKTDIKLKSHKELRKNKNENN